MPNPATNRGVSVGVATRLVAGREIRVRTFNRPALLGLLFSTLIIAGLIFVPKFLAGDGAPATVAVLGMPADRLAVVAEQMPGYRLVPGHPGQTPNEDIPFVVEVGAGATTGTAWQTSQLADLENIAIRLQLADLRGTGADVPVRLDAVTDDSENIVRLMVGYLVVVLLFGQVVGMASAVTQALMEEKGNRVIDLLQPKVRPLALLWGKVIGTGVAGLVQTAVLGVVAIALLLVSGERSTLGIVLDVSPMVLVWYVLGFLFMGVFYGAVGALMRKPDDVPSLTVPMQLLNMLTFFVGVVAVQSPGAGWVDVASKIPPFSAILVPLGTITRESTTTDALISAVIIVACSVLLSVVGARLFSLAVRTDSPGEALRRFFRRDGGPRPLAEVSR